MDKEITVIAETEEQQGLFVRVYGEDVLIEVGAEGEGGVVELGREDIPALIAALQEVSNE